MFRRLHYWPIINAFNNDFSVLEKNIHVLVFNNPEPNTEDPRYNDSLCYKRFCCKIEFAVTKKNLKWTRLKHEYRIFLNNSFINHTFCVFVRIASSTRFK